MASKLRVQVIVHAGVRLMSGLLSFYLFGLIARMYPAGQVKHVYFFLFVFGFAATALRTLGNVSAGLDPSRTRTANLRRVQTAMGEVALSCVAVVPGAMWLLAAHVEHPPLLLPAALILAVASIDADMLRGLLRRDPMFSIAFGAGSALSVCLLLALPGASSDLAVTALLLQWLPVCSVNVGLIARVLRKSLRRAWGRLRQDGSILLVLTFVALFDGSVLNLPFFLGTALSVESGLEIAIVIRLFSASLVFFPLVLHWSNSDALRRLAASFSIPSTLAYLLLQSCAAVLCGSAFAAAFYLIAQKPVSLAQMLAFYALVASYCVYATAARFAGARQSTSALALLLAAAVAGLWGAVLLLVAGPGLSALSMAALQCLALLCGAGLIWYRAERAGTFGGR